MNAPLPAADGTAPADAADPVASREDVVGAYRIILGRDPESEAVVAANRQRPAGRVVAALLRSAECRAVLERLAADLPPPHLALGPEEALAALRWARSRGWPAPEGGVAPATATTAAALVPLLLDAALAAGPEALPEPLATRLAALREEGGTLLRRLCRTDEAADRRQLARLFHGPAAAAEAVPAAGSLHALLQRLVAEPRFHDGVLRPILAGEPPPCSRLAEAAAAEVAAWVARSLGLAEAGHPCRALAGLLALPTVAEMVARAWPASHAPLRAALPALAAWSEPPPRAPARSYGPMPGAADVLAWSEDGVFVEGWMDDRVNRAVAIRLLDTVAGEDLALPAYRARRPDVDRHLGLPNPAELGLWTAALLPHPASAEGLEFQVAHRHGGAASPFAPGQRLPLGRQEFLDHVLAYLGRRLALGSAAAQGFADLDASLGGLLGELHGRLAATRAVTARGAFRHGSGRPVVSLVCVLYGLPDFLYLLVAQFARFVPLGAFEFVFVCNSPEMEDAVLRDAELAAFTFGTDVRVIGLNGNCGFSYANNRGIEAASADSILAINPDVFPRDAAAVRHLLARAEAGPGRDLAGGLLYYADGTVMHDGMVFEPDRRLAAVPGGGAAVVVEHLRKGFPDRPGQAAEAPRPVPAVSGALMLFSRRALRDLGGPFEEAFIYGHYEDADLCLRLREAGGAVLLDPALRFWHYEGRGSIKRPEHAGSALYNRWLFSRRWGGRLLAEA